MLLIWGSKLYGKVDEVPGLFHVATRFGHLWYLPIIPMGSHLVLASEDGRVHGLAVGFSFKSLAMTWIRAGLLIVGIGFLCNAMLILNDRQTKNSIDWIGPAVVGVLLLIACGYACFAKRCCRANYFRAVELSERAGFNDEGKVLLELHFGKMSPEEAAELIEIVRRDDAAAAMQAPPTHPSIAS